MAQAPSRRPLASHWPDDERAGASGEAALESVYPTCPEEGTTRPQAGLELRQAAGPALPAPSLACCCRCVFGAARAAP